MIRSKRLTDKGVAALKPKAQRYEVWEGDGFGLRITPRGVKSFVWVFRFKNRTRRITLGQYPAMGLADARFKLAEVRRTLGEGKDPGAEVVEFRRAERAADTVETLVDDYLENWAKPRKRSAAEDERCLRKDVVSAWKGRKAKDIQRRDVIALLDGIVARGSPIMANRTFEITRKMFNWAISRDILAVNPCHMLKPPAKESSRDRVLNSDEILTFWHGLNAAIMTETMRLAMRFMLTTAQRRGEVMGAEWSEIQGTIWMIPGERAKNGLPHRVPLSELATALLAEIKANAGGSNWLFPSPRTDKHIRGSAVDHSMRRNLDAIGLPDIRPHDLRRSAASHMASLGIGRLTIGKVLNHVDSGVISTYDRYSYDDEKRRALEAWGRRLEEIVSKETAPANVVRLPRG